MEKIGRKRNPLPRPCERCGKRYQPRGRHGKLCDNCRLNRKAEEVLK